MSPPERQRRRQRGVAPSHHPGVGNNLVSMTFPFLASSSMSITPTYAGSIDRRTLLLAILVAYPSRPPILSNYGTRCVRVGFGALLVAS